MRFPTLPLLESVPNKYPEIDFSNCVLIAIQHLLASNGSLLEVLNGLGLSYDRMFVLGKVYSTNRVVYDELKRRGVHCHPFGIAEPPIEFEVDYREQLATAALELLDDAKQSLATLAGDKTLLVVDDGGVLIGTVHSQAFILDARIVAVEQTRSGAEYIRALPGLAFLVVDVAESPTKLQDESPYIAASIVAHIQKRIGATANKHALVVGYGAIGKRVARQLKPQVKSLAVYDRIDVAADEIVTLPSLNQALRECDVIVGCVGRAWLPADYAALLRDGVVLASGSSSNTEFLGLRLAGSQRGAAGASGPFQNVHSDYSFHLENGIGWVLNAGFPVNFDGSKDPIAPHTIELTRRLMLSGILQAMQATGRGLIPLRNQPESGAS